MEDASAFDSSAFAKLGASKSSKILDDLSTAVGSDTSSVDEQSSQGECPEMVALSSAHEVLHHNDWSEDGHADEQEEGADEESEFSLDGRLATIKRWRAYRRSADRAVVDVGRSTPRMQFAFQKCPDLEMIGLDSDCTDSDAEAVTGPDPAPAPYSIESLAAENGLPGLLPRSPPGLPCPLPNTDDCNQSCLLPRGPPGLLDPFPNIADCSIGSDTWSIDDQFSLPEPALPLSAKGLLYSWSPDEHDDEQEEGADEESEFSLDGRLATMKRWRAYRAKVAHTSTTTEPKPGFLPRGPPGFAPAHHEVASANSGSSCQGGCMQPEQCHLNPASLNIMRVEASRLMETGMPWLQQQIRSLSMDALKVDAWEALANPLPEDPEWQLLALVGCGSFVGFGTYAFFDEGLGTVMSVHHLAIAETCRGMGCGRKLLQDLSCRAQAHGAWAIKLHSRPEAVKFYERAGFSEVGANHLMELRLSD